MPGDKLKKAAKLQKKGKALMGKAARVNARTGFGYGIQDRAKKKLLKAKKLSGK